MRAPARLLFRHRVVLAALAVSATLHAAVIVGARDPFGAVEEEGGGYAALLEPGTTLVDMPVEPAVKAAPAPAAPRRVHARPRPRLASIPQPIEPLAAEPLADLPPLAEMPVLRAPAPPKAEPEAAPSPEKLALAQPAVPIPTAQPKLAIDTLPEHIRITYALTSSFADGRAVYRWKRDGDRYEISSEAEAIGFFTLFLEGRIRQESWGVITPDGLRPEGFLEHRPNTADEGLKFDWEARKVTMDLGDRQEVAELADNTVDWLSMIFQLAHMPPKSDPFSLRVYTQRKKYQFELKVLGEETLELPFGTARALHLRHQAANESEAVDVWLGVNQHYLPVKLRYPVARNRLVVDQVAKSIDED